MPSHQEHDLIVVLALNIDNDTIPSVPVNSGWTSAHYSSVSGVGAIGWRIAYKYAKVNTETVGNWFPADRIIVAIYRNARGPVGTAQAASVHLQTKSPTQPLIALSLAVAGTRLLHFAISASEQ